MFFDFLNVCPARLSSRGLGRLGEGRKLRAGLGGVGTVRCGAPRAARSRVPTFRPGSGWRVPKRGHRSPRKGTPGRARTPVGWGKHSEQPETPNSTKAQTVSNSRLYGNPRSGSYHITLIRKQMLRGPLCETLSRFGLHMPATLTVAANLGRTRDQRKNWRAPTQQPGNV
jgi:hypothetical protein